ncbi:hypothetical protein [Mycobacterium avium]|uniref:hypothetical protein n=1 Tax=Mycobacterium avium TaxID=1764 RepID=UPI000BB03426|nr:hypothetical protein [Mycobacterium avium]PBA68849.1 hypothetical protein CKJ76_26200 [Mycobacterium avium]
MTATVPQAVDRVTAAAVAEARLAASERLIAWLQDSGAVTIPASLAGRPGEVTAVLLARDEADPRYRVLGAFAQRWACDVLTILAAALVQKRGERLRTPDVVAVEYAVSIGVPWTAIGEAVGVSAPTAHLRYRERITPTV